ncbi:ADP-ribosylglycohydrolase family protein [Desertihabitans aurantiacus]|uniref:ADP-ribosylglycohydrolase family protein n=1 Tax=Desertihabitans aurantiacus TaxID=2282477 RepID=UPI000DF7A0EA|nr:ADP-ribosylglycohydrolase family protein [Desertihabitans aurantiacus]
MYKLDITGDTFRDKVLGCWIGKNAGGTLGTPVEEAWGREEPFDIWWYPELQSGGLPNDDLEMQLVWLTALQQVGPDLKAADLARYWLDHIGYNFDEYGLSKANLRLGLEPPVSGAWNNWFTDCMGCPIRSEVWACVAPGHPRIAARYAYEDAICDHAGGESVYGELFNVAIQSAAFVISDRDQLLDIGLSYVPADSATHRAVTTARQAHRDGVDWKEARQRVLHATPSAIAQYSPLNLGFQTIGWLYGKDFGEAMCITVNCGYDTDSSGGSIGSWLGIRAGIAQLPERWIQPFGMGLSTNESWGGVRHLSDGTTPIPVDIIDLTDAIVGQAERVLRHHGRQLDGATVHVDEADLFADESIRELWQRSPWQVHHERRQLAVTVDYLGEASVAPAESKHINVLLHNPHPDPLTVDVTVDVPPGWGAVPGQAVELPAAQDAVVELTIPVGDRATIEQRNLVLVHAQPRHFPTVAPVPVPLPGASAWQVRPAGSEVDWLDLAVRGNELPVAQLLDDHGAVMLRTWVEAAEPVQVRLAVDTSVDTSVSVNGQPLLSYQGPRKVRPSYGAAEQVNRVVDLDAGFNEVLLELAPASGDGPAEDAVGHCYLSEPDRLRNGIVDLGRTRTPDDRPQS